MQDKTNTGKTVSFCFFFDFSHALNNSNMHVPKQGIKGKEDCRCSIMKKSLQGQQLLIVSLENTLQIGNEDNFDNPTRIIIEYLSDLGKRLGLYGSLHVDSMFTTRTIQFWVNTMASKYVTIS